MSSHVVCVVDDDESVRRSLIRLIRSCGLTVETHASAESYLAVHGNVTFACVILDIHLGSSSGFDLMERIARLPTPPPVIVITGHDDPATRARVLKSGASAFFLKPFDASALVSAIGDAIGHDPDTISHDRRGSDR